MNYSPYIVATIALLIAPPAFAESALTPLPAPAERPYPYEVLGLQPGDPLGDILAVYADRTDVDPTSETETLRVQSPDGAVFTFDYQLFTRIGDVGVNGRLAKVAQDQVSATLSSDVMEQRPMAIYRSIRQPSEDLPEPLELRAQIEDLYGTPSRVEIDGLSMTLTYAWANDGFISDLDVLEDLIHEETTTRFDNTTTRQTAYELCSQTTIYRNSVTYRFEHPREELIRPGCLATFTVTYRGEPSMTSIGFSLVDYELGRMHMQELDRQIIEALTGEEVEASDMDL